MIDVAIQAFVLSLPVLVAIDKGWMGFAFVLLMVVMILVGIGFVFYGPGNSNRVIFVIKWFFDFLIFRLYFFREVQVLSLCSYSTFRYKLVIDPNILGAKMSLAFLLWGAMASGTITQVHAPASGCCTGVMPYLCWASAVSAQGSNPSACSRSRPAL